MTDLMKQLDKLHRSRIVKSDLPDSILGVTLKDSKRGPLVNFEQVKTVIGQWVADNSDLLSAQAEVTRLREALTSIERNSHEPLTIHVARGALAPKEPS